MNDTCAGCGCTQEEAEENFGPGGFGENERSGQPMCADCDMANGGPSAWSCFAQEGSDE